MLKSLTFTLVLLIFLTLETRAQNLHDDSIKRIAVADARKFKLDKAGLKTFRQNHRNLEHEYVKLFRSPSTSGQRIEDYSVYISNREPAWDYFKPVVSAVSDTVLLVDSVYVNAYREEAWQRTSHRHRAGHYVWLTAVVMGGAEIIALTAYVISTASH